MIDPFHAESLARIWRSFSLSRLQHYAPKRLHAISEVHCKRIPMCTQVSALKSQWRFFPSNDKFMKLYMLTVCSTLHVCTDPSFSIHPNPDTFFLSHCTNLTKGLTTTSAGRLCKSDGLASRHHSRTAHQAWRRIKGSWDRGIFTADAWSRRPKSSELGKANK